MNQDSIQSQQPKTLVKLFKLDRDQTTWSPSDLGAILRHQLRSPLIFDLGDLAQEQHRSIDDMTHVGPSQQLVTFDDVLHHPKPPIELLGLIKDFAKNAGEKEGVVPREVATVLYYLSIVAAILRHNQRITSLPDANLRQGVQWAMRQTWLDDRSKSLFQEGLAKLPA